MSSAIPEDPREDQLFARSERPLKASLRTYPKHDSELNYEL